MCILYILTIIYTHTSYICIYIDTKATWLGESPDIYLKTSVTERLINYLVTYPTSTEISLAIQAHAWSFYFTNNKYCNH